MIFCCGGEDGGNDSRSGGGNPDSSSTGGQTHPVCAAGTGSGRVQAPEFVRNLDGQTGWFASPIVADLDHDGVAHDAALFFTNRQPGYSGNSMTWGSSSAGPILLLKRPITICIPAIGPIRTIRSGCNGRHRLPM